VTLPAAKKAAKSNGGGGGAKTLKDTLRDASIAHLRTSAAASLKSKNKRQNEPAAAGAAAAKEDAAVVAMLSSTAADVERAEIDAAAEAKVDTVSAVMPAVPAVTNEDSKATKKAEKEDTFDAELSALIQEWPQHVPLLNFVLSHREAEWQQIQQTSDAAPSKQKADQEAAARADVLAAAEAVIAGVDSAAVAQHFGQREPADATPAFKKTRGDMKDRRAALRDAHLAKCDVLGAAIALAPPAEKAGMAEKALEAAVEELQLWVDPKRARHVLFLARRAKMAGRFAVEFGHVEALLKMEAAGKCPKKDVSLTRKQLCELRIGALENLGWDAWAKLMKDRLLVDYPASYPAF